MDADACDGPDGKPAGQGCLRADRGYQPRGSPGSIAKTGRTSMSTVMSGPGRARSAWPASIASTQRSASSATSRCARPSHYTHIEAAAHRAATEAVAQLVEGPDHDRVFPAALLASARSIAPTPLRQPWRRCPCRSAEADGNRTRRRRCAPSAGFEDRGDHQVPRHLHLAPYRRRGHRLTAATFAARGASLRRG